MQGLAFCMSNKTIAKFSGFVIFLATACLINAGCGFVSSSPGTNDPNSKYGPPIVTGTIELRDITESSGIAASRCQSNVLWTHNDSGDDAFIFAVNASGQNLGTWKVPNAENIDWEDIAAYKDHSGKCFLYIGEIGDNKSKRHERLVYRVPEPIIIPAGAKSDRKSPLTSDNAEMLSFKYPDSNPDAETLMVHPETGDIYVITKRISGPAGVYRIKPIFGNTETQKAEKIAEISVPAIPNGLLTGGDISPDGRRIVVCDYGRAYEFTLPGTSTNFDEIWKQTPEPIELGKRAGGEAVCYSVDGTSIFATSERRNSPVIEVKIR